MAARPSAVSAWISREMVLLFAVMATLPLWIGAVGLYQYLGIEIAIWMIYGLGFNLLLGYSGLPSFGHGAFFGIGAYVFGLFQAWVFENLVLGIAFATVAAFAAGAVVACFLSHRRGIYFALMTIAFGQVFWFIAIKWHTVTGGEDGLLNIPRPALELGLASVPLGSNVALFYFVLLVLAVVVVALWRLVHSPFGKVLQAVRQNEERARFVGYNVWRFKWAVFSLSAAVAGLAGSLFSMAQQSAYPDVMSLHASGVIVMMTLIGGGFVSFWGPVVGVAVYFLARDVLGAVTETWLLWFGLVFVVSVLFKPEGIAGVWQECFGGALRLRFAGAPLRSGRTGDASAVGPEHGETKDVSAVRPERSEAKSKDAVHQSLSGRS
ncbi:MAG: branched-chain amino acid ABC transporter permease [Deltaproteobacteria bacterium]|nr:branched-chain amino acid ABC transporter permease [Deltaproteobacteria bacterium]